MTRVLLVLAIIFNVAGCAQKREMNSWTAHNLVSEVRGIKLTTFTTEFKNHLRVPETELSSVVFKFDKNGLEQVMEVFDSTGELAARSTPTYENGVVSGTISEDIRAQTSEIWTVTKTHGSFFAEEMNSTRDDKPFRKSVNSFDDKGRGRKIDVENADGSLSLIIERDYYDSGDIKSEKTTYPDRTELRKFTYTKHDKFGNWTERLAEVGENVEITKRVIDYY